MRRLLLDAGNSSVKWAVVEDATWCVRGRSGYTDLAALEAECVPGTRGFIASVCGPTREQALVARLRTHGIVPVALQAQATFGDLRNGYRAPQQLGVDRWMGLVAARQRTREAALVVSAGTALTIDSVTADGEFLGGLIVPGAALMRQVLQQGTAGVAVTPGQCQAFPRCTADAVESGIVAALCGAIRQQYGLLAAQAGRTPHCLLTGGDADWLLPHLDLPAHGVPDLVLEGMERVSRESLS